ncbi:Pathogenesis-related protein 1B [Dichanthelium oligosanthes]|jgi:pathogenesis-related protein 1|uniref:Pathogenesis-related protein 1B n=1 Tax=Dichanthelium oligosanthes TaxID=888268 RepID=A0A1E5VCD2_9POAL|nr:Pathogenesis-related protein 1B [Dichanthelium oligosanthes]
MATTKMAVVAFVLVLSMAMASMAQNTADELEFVALHNVARREVGVEDVVWDETVAAFARAYAARRAGDCSLQHSEDAERWKLGYGENIVVGPPGSDLTVAVAVQEWVKEKQYYDSASGMCLIGLPQELRCGHYTQVVWRNTKAIGCARVKCDNGGVFVTCNYTPAGNVYGQRPF